MIQEQSPKNTKLQSWTQFAPTGSPLLTPTLQSNDARAREMGVFSFLFYSLHWRMQVWEQTNNCGAVVYMPQSQSYIGKKLANNSCKKPSSETQGQLVGSIKCPWWKFTVRSRRAPGHLLLPNQFQKRLNCLLLIGQKKSFLANQRREAAGWLSCFLTRHSFPHQSP